MKSKITPTLWFDGTAEEAARFYCSLFPDSRIVSVNRSAADNPSTQAGEVLTVDFELAGQPFMGLNGGPDFRFNEAISFTIDCQDQAEVIATGRRSSRAAANTASAVGSRIATASRGRSSLVSCRSSWLIRTGKRQSA